MQKTEVFPDIFVGDVIVSLSHYLYRRSIGSLHIVLEKSSKGNLHYEIYDNISYNSEGWRKATQQEKEAYEQGIRHINDIPVNKISFLEQRIEYFEQKIVEAKKELQELRNSQYIVGRVAFIYDGCIASGWALPNGNWEANSDVGIHGEFSKRSVKKYVIFDKPLWEYES